MAVDQPTVLVVEDELAQREVLSYKPDIVVIPLIHNDFDESYRFLKTRYASSFMKLERVEGKFPHITYREALEMLEKVEEAVDGLPRDVRETAIEDDAWRVMVPSGLTTNTAASIRGFVREPRSPYTSTTPPALPRPPAWTWAFTTTG